MNITISSRKTTVKDSFREWAEKKLKKLDRFFEEDAQAAIVVSNERDRETVEITVQSRGMIFRAEKTSADRLDSLDAVVDSLIRQIVKNKNKLEKSGINATVRREMGRDIDGACGQLRKRYKDQKDNL